MKLYTYILVGMLCCAEVMSAADNPVTITTPTTALMVNAPEGGDLRLVYYGKNLGADGLGQLLETRNNLNRSLYPAFGDVTGGETALRVIHSDGNPTTELKISGVEQESLPDGTLTSINMQDRHYPFYVDVYYRSYDSSDVIETWTKITNNEKKPVTLTQYDSGTISFYRGDAWLTHLNGSWAAECNMVEEPLDWGMKVIKNKGGNRNGHGDHPEVMISLSGKPREDYGEVIGAVLSWGGNFKMRLDSDNNSVQTLFAGINEEAGEYVLEPGKSLMTPPLILTFSDEGKGGVSRNLHRYARLDGKLQKGNETRPILLNSWEGIRFDVSQEKMDEMMADFSALGGEMFVMDDGWFGEKYPRNNGSQGLGDWMIDRRKLPGGIAGLIKSAHDKGLKFGIWIEPESTNSRSELMEKHPDWALQTKNRNPHYGRGGTQLLLDLCNPKVQDMVVNMVDTLLSNNPGIDYVKWDMNVALSNYGSTYLKSDRQTHIYVEYQKGLNNVLERIKKKHPDVLFQACGGGGGRVSYAMMPYFGEFWVSDNTDALQRIFMQWGMSQFYPSNSMAQHVSEVPNQCTGRVTPFKYRFDVAMSGRLGLELIPSELTDEEKDMAKKAIGEYKGIRETVQTGDLYRLLSPYDGGPVTSLMYVSPDKRKAVFFAYKLQHFNNEILPHIKLTGLDPNKVYHVREINAGNRKHELDGKNVKGDVLMKAGLDPRLYSEYASRVLEFTEI